MPGKLTREELEQRLINLPALEGEGKGLQPDVTYTAVEALKHQRKHFNNEQQVLLESLLPRLQQPAMLFTTEQRQQLLAKTDLTTEHEALAIIKNVIENLKNLQQFLLAANQQQASPQLQANLQTLIMQYQNCLIQLCQSLHNSPGRQVILEPFAQLIAEGLGAFTLSQALARKLLCRNEQGQRIKENETGNRAVVCYGDENHRIHFKPNYPLLKEYIAPGVEYMMYSFHQLLGDDAIAPTMTIKIRNMLVQQQLPTDVPIRYFERAVQAGLTVEGLLLQDILRLIQVVDLITEKLGSERFISVLDDLLNQVPLQKLLQERPDLKYPTAEKLLEAFCGYMMRFDKGEHLSDFDDWQQRNAAIRGRKFVSLAQYPQEALFTYSIIREYPELMAKQKLALLLEIPFAIKTIRKLYPNATTETIAQQIPQLWDKFDTDNFAIHCLGSLLCNHTDAKADNMMVEVIRDNKQQIQSLRIVGIDNDKTLAPAIEGNKEHKMRIKNILYFFPQMQQPIADSLRQHLLRHTPEELIAKWLLSLNQQNQRTNNLIPFLTDGEALQGRKLGEVADASDYALLETGNIPIRLTPGVVQEVYRKLKLIRQRLQAYTLEKNPAASSITYQALLDLVEPFVSQYYQALKQKPEYRHPLDALQAIYDGKHSIEELLNEGFELARQQPLTGNLMPVAHSQVDEKDDEDNRTQTIEEAAKAWVQQVDWEQLVTTKQLSAEQVIELLNNLGEHFALSSISLSPKTATACLQLAAPKGLYFVTKLLLASSADITYTDEVGRTVLHRFIKHFLELANHEIGKQHLRALIEILINHKDAPVNVQDEKGYTPLHELQVTNESYSLAETLIRQLLSRGADTELVDKERSETRLGRSIRHDDVLTFCLLVSLGVGGKTEASNLLAFINKHSNNPQHQEKLQNAQKQLAQQNSLFAWYLSLKKLTQATKPTEAEIKQHCKGFHKSFIFEIEGALSGKRYLRPEVAKAIFDPNSNPIKANTKHGLRAVAFYQDEDIAVHFKFYPELPGIEEAVQVLYQQIIGYNPATSELFRFIDMDGNGYPVLISQHVPGVKADKTHQGNIQDLFNHYKNQPEKINAYFDELDSKSFSENLLMAILTNPEDGKPDNEVLQPYINPQGQKGYRIVSIDNDHAFGMPLVKNEKGEIELQIKTLVYCVKQMQDALHNDVINNFLKLDPASVIRKWLQILEGRQARYEKLFAIEKEKLLARGMSLLDRGVRLLNSNTPQEQPVIIPIVFARKSVVHVYEKFLTLQMLLRENSTICGDELLRRTLPFVAGNYIEGAREAKEQYDIVTLAHRFHHTASELYLGKKPDSYGISKTSYQFMVSLNIPLKEVASYSPTHALKEFEAAQKEAVILSTIKQELKRGRAQNNNKDIEKSFLTLVIERLFGSRIEDSIFSDKRNYQRNYKDKFKAFIDVFNQIQFDSTKEDIISNIPFNILPDPYPRRFIDEAVKFVNFTHLKISHSSELTDGDLKIILTGSPNIRSATLSHCKNKNLTESFLADLSKTNKTLEQLTLIDLPHLRRILVVSSYREFRYNDSPLVLPQLQELTLINLPELSTWQLEAPQLKKLTLESCPKVTHRQMHQLLLSTPQVESLVVKHSPQLNEKALLKVLLCHHQQWTASHIKPFMEGDCLNLQGLPITDKSLALIAERQLPIKHLNLRNCRVTHQGLIQLIQHKILVSIMQCDYAKGESIATLKGHINSVLALAILPAGRIVSGSDDNTLCIWDASTLQSIATLKGHTNSVYALAILPDGRIVSGSSDTTLRIWDASTHQSIATLTGYANSVRALAILPDGRIVSGSYDTILRIWDASTLQSIATLKGHTNSVYALAILPDGRIVSGSDDNTLRIWDASTHQSIATLKGHTNHVRALAILPDGRIVSGSDDNTLRIWDASTLQSIAILTGHTNHVRALAILPAGRIVSSSLDNTLRIWDASTHQSIATLKGHTSYVGALASLPDGRIVSGSDDKTLRLWSFPDLVLDYTSLQVLKGKCRLTLNQRVLSLTVSPTDSLLLKPACETFSKLLHQGNVSIDITNSSLIITCIDSATAYRTLKHLQALQPVTMFCQSLPATLTDKDIEDWLQQRWQLTEVNLPANTVITPNGLQRLISHLPTLEKLEYFNPEPNIATLKGHTNSVLALAILPDRRIVSGSADKTLRIWDAFTLASTATLTGHTYAVRALAILPDGRIVSGSDDHTLRIWDATTLASTATLTGHNSPVYALAILPDGRIVSGSWDNTLRIWDATTLTSTATLTGHISSVMTLAILPDGRIVSGSADKTLRIWDATTLASTATLTGHANSVSALTILPDRRIVSGSNDHTLRIWDATALVSTATLTGHANSVSALAILPDSRIVSGSGDNTLCIWDASFLASTATLAGHANSVSALAILPDGRIVSGSDDSTLRIWDTGIKHLNLLLLEKCHPQLSQHVSQLKLNFDIAICLPAEPDDEMQAVISTYQNVIQFCFRLMPSAESNPLCLTYHCQDAAQALAITQFLQQCWQTRKQTRQQPLPHTQEDKPALMPQLPIHLPFELRPIDENDFRRMVIQLETNPAISLLNLSGVTLGKEGLSCLRELIRRNKTLTFIDISQTGLTDQDVQQLLEALKANQTLMRLSLKGNQISAALLTEVHNHFKANTEAQLKDLEIPIEELHLESKQQLGEGSFGKVYSLQWSNSKTNQQQLVAMKELKATDSEKEKQRFKREACFLAVFKHPYIVQLYGINFRNELRIIMEFFPNGSLQRMLNCQKSPFPIIKQVRYALDIAYGLAFIHECKGMHLDLKPDNILLANDGRLKIGDFGTSLFQEHLRSTVRGKRGTRPYIAPEIWFAIKEEDYTPKADIYSYGIILWQIASCKKPYSELKMVNEDALGPYVIEQEGRPEPRTPKETTEGIARLIRRCWKKNREKRPDADKIITRLEKEIRAVQLKQ